MGREVKRVPLDFRWPLRTPWQGFVMSDDLNPVTCESCDGTGLNPETRQLSKDWYDHDGFGSRWWYDYKTGIDGEPATSAPWKVFGESRAWQYKLEQDEVDNLISEGRLHGYTDTWDVQERKWVRDPAKPWPTAAQINREMQFGFGHDGINHYICTRFRAKKLGFYGVCPHCQGESHIFRDEAQRRAYDAWERTEPPEGEGWQMWETTSEGSPISIVCETPEKLAAWLVSNRASSFGHDGASFAAWLSMIRAGWAPSMVGDGGGLQGGVAALADKSGPVFNVFEGPDANDDIVPTPRRSPSRFPRYMQRDVVYEGGHDSYHAGEERARKTHMFEAVYPDAAFDAAAPLLTWLRERGLYTQTEERIGRDLVLRGKLTADEAFEFKMQWR